MKQEIIEFTSFNDLQNFFSSLDANWIFRGQADFNWELKTSMDRLQLIHPLKDPVKKSTIEKSMIEEVRKDIHMYSSSTKELLIDDLHIISFLQHHSAPTRLLDFSTSYLTALFFAVENSFQDSAVYAINKDFLQTSARMVWEPKGDFEDKLPQNCFTYAGARMSCYRIKKLLTEAHYNFNRADIFEAFLLQFPLPQKFVTLVKPYHSFQRISSQSGVLLSSGSINDSFEENLKGSLEAYPIKDHVVQYKVKIPLRLKSDILSRLYRLNISSASLYSGVEGFVKSLATKVMVNIYDVSGDKL